ncbi:MAG: hypothetical protein N3B21_10465 [Clostridia bacterium]|nr:hypothetical protein [Clostridia bacterium]
MKLYLDMNVYNRIFDDQNQLRIRFEAMAIDIIMELVEKGTHKLVWSFMLKDETRVFHIHIEENTLSCYQRPVRR